MDFPGDEISFEWITDIANIDRNEWNNIYGDGVLNNYNFFKSMFISDFENVDFSYLVIQNKKRILCIVPCFTYLLDIQHISSSGYIKKAIKIIRKIFPGFLKIKTFIIGSYVSTCHHHIGILKETPQYLMSKIRDVVNKEVKNRARKEKSSLILIKEASSGEINNVISFFDSNFLFFEEYPRAVIPVSDFLGDYPLFLKKKHRKTYRKYITEFNNLYKWEIIENYEQYIPHFYELYKKTWKKSNTKFEFLNEDFFKNLIKNLPEQTFCLIARNDHGDILLMEILLEDEEKLIPFYLGIDYTGENTTILYLNNIYKVVKEAKARKKRIVELGQTAYYPKIMSGALVEKMYLGFYSYKKIWKYLIKHIFKYIFTPIEIFPNVYLEQYKNIAKEHCEALEYKIYN